MFVIKHKTKPLYFNEDADDFGGLDDASYYRKTEGDLPTDDCAWCSLWAIDEVQFARLLAEIHMAGAIDAVVIGTLIESMDLEEDQINSLFDRALEFWEQLKEKL